MRAREVLARVALLAYPREFRAQFGVEMLSDVAERASIFSSLADLLRGGLTMRTEALLRDAGYAWRRLRASPLFVAIVVLTFALGIGANVAVFSVLDTVAIRPLPFPDPASLAIVQSHTPDGTIFPVTSLVDASDIRQHATVFQGVAGVGSSSATLMLHGRPYTLNGLAVMPGYFSIAGLRPQLGRLLDTRDTRPGVHTMVISDALWHRRFGGNPAVLGTSHLLDGTPTTIVGILEPHQLLPVPSDEAIETLDYIVATSDHPNPRGRGRRVAGTIVRLAPGVTFARANADLALVSQRLAHLYPKTDKRWRLSVESFDAAVLGPTTSALWLLFAAVIGILLIACANIGNMLGARWSSRDREFAIRRALGASNARIGAQLLTETALLAALGGVVGVALAYGALAVIAPSAADVLPYGTVGINGWSLLFAFGIVLLATLGAGVWPLLTFRSRDLQTTLKSAGRGGDGARRHGVRGVLAAAEVALTLALVVVGGLSVRNIVAMVNTPLGIRSHGVVVTGALAMPNALNANKRAAASAIDTMLGRIQVLPGVKRAAIALMYPLGDVALEGPAPVVGRSYPPGGVPVAWSNAVSAQYFDTLGVPVIAGRTFTDAEAHGSAPVVVVNEAFAKAYLAGQRVVGRRLRIGGGPSNPATIATIVGVVGDERFGGLLSPREPAFYVPATQQIPRWMSIVVYAPKVPPVMIGREIDAAFAQSFPTIEPPHTHTIAGRIAAATGPMRVGAMLAAALGLIALVLACAGIFGVVSFSVSQRVREFGIRMALGARKRDVIADVLRRSLVTTSVGVVAGILIAAIAARAVSSQLSDVSPFDPWTFVVTIGLVFASATLASLQPALRATGAQAADVLRYE